MQSLTASDLDLVNDPARLFSPSRHSVSAAHASRPTHYDGVSPPIALTSIFQLQSMENSHASGHMYSRVSNPTVRVFEKQLASLYSGRGEDAVDAVSFSSGMAAAACVLQRLTQQPWSDGAPSTQHTEGPVTREMVLPQQPISHHVLVSDEVFYSVYNIVDNLVRDRGVVAERFDVRDVEETLKRVRADTSVVFLESCSNPSMKIPDFENLFARLKERKAELVGREGREEIPPMTIVVDNTWMTAELFNPFMWGADVVVESGSKYVSGSTTVILGCALSASPEMFRSLRGWRSLFGCQPGPIGAFFGSKGLDTLSLRMEKYSTSGLRLAEFLNHLPFVSRAVYPSLPSHVDVKLCKKYFRGGSGVVYFHALLSTKEASKLMSQTKHVLRSTSYGSSHFLWNIRARSGFSTDVQIAPEGQVGGEGEEEEEGETLPRPPPAAAAVEQKIALKGTWFRLAIGLTPVVDVMVELAQVLTALASRDFGAVESFDRETRRLDVTGVPRPRKMKDRSHVDRQQGPMSVGDVVAFVVPERPEGIPRDHYLLASVERVVESDADAGVCCLVVSAEALAMEPGVQYRIRRVRSNVNSRELRLKGKRRR